MDASKLNAKQRRLVRRHREREGGSTASTTDAKVSEDNETATKDETTKIEQQNESVSTSNTPPTNVNIKEILAKLEGLNSKERRKYLRQLKASSGGAIDESVITAAQEQAKKVAERNEKQAANAPPSDNNKKKAADTPESTTKPKKKRRKKGPPVDESKLPPEERRRREEQRRMQKEAQERRDAGLVDPNRHPLNSERRRANRRKPSQAMLIAQAKKEKMAEKGRFNAVGFQMRQGRRNGD